MLAHQGENFGDEVTMIFVNMEFPGKRFAFMNEYYRWENTMS